MRVLLSTIGSRGEVQPVVALADQLRGAGHSVRICAPPDFGDWIEGRGISFILVGPELRGTAKVAPTTAAPTPDQRRQMIEGTVTAQFTTILTAAEGCDVVVACGALQVAAHSIAELLGIRYVYAAYCPITLPSPYHAPPPLPGWKPDPTADNHVLWAQDTERWNEIWAPALNSQRTMAGLPSIDDVRTHIFTDHPWLAADPTVAPWPADLDVVQTGAWILPDERPLSPELETFLAAGEPPVYFGFGSIRAPEDLGKVMIEAARALGRRAIVFRGWAELALVDDAPDCLSIGEVNQQALFRRVAAAVHHGGAGTTTAAAGAGVPQVVIPQHYDQPYFAGRVRDLGIGCAHATGAPTVDSLVVALDQALRPEVAGRAKLIADAVRTDGAEVAARRLLGAG